MSNTWTTGQTANDQMRELYVEAVKHVAIMAFKKYGPKLTAKVESHLREQVEYSSWVVSGAHADLILQFSGYIQPVQSVPKSCQLDYKRIVSIKAMMHDVLSEFENLIRRAVPKYWKLRFVEAKRFVYRADFDDVADDIMDEVMSQEETGILQLAAVICEQYKRALLPVPLLEPVAFNADHVEIPKVRE